VSDEPAPPNTLPKAKFTGGIRGGPLRFWGGTWPFGHLAFDENEIRISGVGMRVSAKRHDVLGVRVKMGTLGTRVSIVRKSDPKESLFFAPINAGAVVDALVLRGWPVLDWGQRP
jgi:hypothetical protein